MKNVNIPLWRDIRIFASIDCLTLWYYFWSTIKYFSIIVVLGIIDELLAGDKSGLFKLRERCGNTQLQAIEQTNRDQTSQQT